MYIIYKKYIVIISITTFYSIGICPIAASVFLVMDYYLVLVFILLWLFSFGVSYEKSYFFVFIFIF